MDTTPSPASNPLLRDMIHALEFYDGSYPREAVEYALANRERITPVLLNILDDVLDDPESIATEEDYFGHLYAVLLLGHFRETEAHDLILRVCRLPAPVLDYLFDELITDELPAVLVRTCGGSFDGIKALARDRNVYNFCRIAATEALALAVCYGALAREEALDFFHGLLEDEGAAGNVDVATFAASAICDIGPEDSMDRITRAFELGYVDSTFIEYEWYESSAEDGSEVCMARTIENLHARTLDNFHDAVSGWACYTEAPELRPAVPLTRDVPKKKSRSKSKRKQVSASRKKNRR